MKDEALYVYDELAKLKLIEPDFHRQMKGVIEASEMLTTRDLFSLALDLSIAGMVRTSASFGFDEEHLTASFAGSLASNLTWFARAYQKAEGKRPLPELKWVHQTKVSEARSGIDFGLLSRVPGRKSGQLYRLILLQAKLGNQQDMTIQIDHVTNKHAVKGRLEWTSDALTILEAAAQCGGGDGPVDSQLKTKAIEIAHKKFERGKPRYQLETLLRTDFRGQSLSGNNRPWCFYVAWHAARLPQAEDVRMVASSVWSNGPDERLNPIRLSDSTITLTKLFDEALYDEKSQYGLELSLDQVGGTVEYLAEVAPDIRILTNSMNPQLEQIFHSRNGYMTSDTLIPNDLLERQRKAWLVERIVSRKEFSVTESSGNPPLATLDDTAAEMTDPPNGGAGFDRFGRK